MTFIDSIARRFGYIKAPQQASNEIGSRYAAAIYQPGAKTARRPGDTKTAMEFATRHPMYFASINHIASAAMGVPLRVLELKPEKTAKQTGRYVSKATAMHVQRQFTKRPHGEQRQEWLHSKGLVAEDVSDDHELRRLLDMVNPISTWSFLAYETAFDLEDAGNAYWELVGGEKFGKPQQIFRIRPDQIEAKPSERGVTGYVVKVNGKETDFDRDEILHFRYPSPVSEYYGLARTTPLLACLETEDERIEYGREFMQNRTQLTGVLVGKDGAIYSEDQAKQILEDFRKQYTGSKNAGVVGFLDAADYRELGHTPKDAEYLAMADRHDIEIGAVTGVPNALFKTKDVNRSNLEAAKSQFWTDTMVPKLTLISDMMNEFLCPRFGENIVVEFDFTTVQALQEEADAIVVRESQKFSDGITTVDEYRQATGHDAWPDGRGNVVRRNPAYQLTSIESIEEAQTPEQTAPPEQQPEPETAPQEQPPEGDMAGSNEAQPKSLAKTIEHGSEQHKALYKAWDDLVRPHERKLKAAVAELAEDLRAEVLAKFEVGKSLKATLPDITVLFDQDNWGQKLVKVVEGAVKPAIAEQGARMTASLNVEGLTFNPDNPIVRDYLTNKQLKVKTVIEDLHSQLKTTIANDVRQGRSIEQISRSINDRFDHLSRAQADTIAQTEVVGGMNVANYSALKEAGIEKHEWIATLDDRVRDTHVECQMQGPIPVGEPFVNGLLYPGDPDGAAAEVIRCRCTIIADTS